MTRTLATYVHVQAPDGAMVAFGPDDELPDWAAGQIGEHCYAAEPADDEDAPAHPPLSGAGSGKAAWLAYADEHDIDVDPDATRDEIAAACGFTS